MIMKHLIVCVLCHGFRSAAHFLGPLLRVIDFETPLHYQWSELAPSHLSFVILRYVHPSYVILCFVFTIYSPPPSALCALLRHATQHSSFDFHHGYVLYIHSGTLLLLITSSDSAMASAAMTSKRCKSLTTTLHCGNPFGDIVLAIA